MLTQMSPRERLTYVLLITLLIGTFAYVGAGQLKRSPELKIEPIADTKAPVASLIGKTPTESGELVVHVVGAVKKRGTIRMPAGSRVEDALRAQGGPLKDADLDAVNLAARLEDGTQLFIPKVGKSEEVAKVAVPYQGGGSNAYRAKPTPLSGSSEGASTSGGMVSLNSANQAQLESLPGIGPATAKKILDYRQAHGGFSSIEELMSVKGIGPKKLEAVRKLVKL